MGLPRGLPENADLVDRRGHDAAQRLFREAAFLERYTQEDFFTIYTASNLPKGSGEKFSLLECGGSVVGAGFGARLRQVLRRACPHQITGRWR